MFGSVVFMNGGTGGEFSRFVLTLSLNAQHFLFVFAVVSERRCEPERSVRPPVVSAHQTKTSSCLSKGNETVSNPGAFSLRPGFCIQTFSRFLDLLTCDRLRVLNPCMMMLTWTFWLNVENLVFIIMNQQLRLEYTMALNMPLDLDQTL